MDDHEIKLKALKRKVEEINTQKIQKTERLNVLRQQRDDLIKKIKAENLTLKTLPETIKQLEQEIEVELQQLQNQVSKVEE